jgi:multiple antibiotic resistance protein
MPEYGLTTTIALRLCCILMNPPGPREPDHDPLVNNPARRTYCPAPPSGFIVSPFLPMDQDFFRFGLAAFVTILVVVDPPGVVPIFVALTKDEGPRRRRAILIRAVLIAFGVALFFLIAGRAVLSYLGVTVHAFSISGGILLFVAAMPMLFGQRGGLQAPEGKERGAQTVAEADVQSKVADENSPRATSNNDISVFPLAMPLLSGPGTIATILLLTSQAGGDLKKLAAIGVAIAVVFLVSFVSLHLGARLIRLVGEGGVHIATRVMGIVLAALAVQYILNGIAGYYSLLRGW